MRVPPAGELRDRLAVVKLAAESRAPHRPWTQHSVLHHRLWWNDGPSLDLVDTELLRSQPSTPTTSACDDFVYHHRSSGWRTRLDIQDKVTAVDSGAGSKSLTYGGG